MGNLIKHRVKEKAGTALRVVGGGFETAGTALQRWAEGIYRNDTAYFEKNPVMRERLMKSIADTKAGKFTERALIEPDGIGDQAHRFLEEYLEVRVSEDGTPREGIYVAGRSAEGDICLDLGYGKVIARGDVTREHLKKQFTQAKYEESETLRPQRRKMYAAALELLDREHAERVIDKWLGSPVFNVGRDSEGNFREDNGKGRLIARKDVTIELLERWITNSTEDWRKRRFRIVIEQLRQDEYTKGKH